MLHGEAHYEYSWTVADHNTQHICTAHELSIYYDQKRLACRKQALREKGSLGTPVLYHVLHACVGEMTQTGV